MIAFLKIGFSSASEQYTNYMFFTVYISYFRADLDAQAIRWEVCDGVKPKDVSVGESEQKISVPIQPPPSNTNKVNT